MSPKNETLTPRQIKVVTAIVLLTITVFSGIFVYADWKGSQVRKKRLSALITQSEVRARNRNFRGMSFEDIKGRSKPIVRGTRWQNTAEELPNVRAWSRYWVISKFPKHDGNGPMPMPQLCAYSYRDSEWDISPSYTVSVPSNAEPGLYIAHYQVNQYGLDYFFEVVDEVMLPQDVRASEPKLPAPLSLRPEKSSSLIDMPEFQFLSSE